MSAPNDAAAEEVARGSTRAAGAAGLLGLALNVVAVALLAGVPHPYRPDDMAAWHAGTSGLSAASEASAACFTFGLLLLVPWARAWGRRGLLGVAGELVAGGALLNAAGTPLVAVVARFLPVSDPANGPVARALLGVTLTLDAVFNACLGAGILLASAGARSWPRGLRALGVVAGLATLPVALQYRDARAADLLAVAGPLWLAWSTWLALRMLREGATRTD